MKRQRAEMRSIVCAGDGNVLRDGDPNQVNHEQESVDDAKELEGGAVKVCQEDGETKRKEQTGDQRHEGQPFTEFMGSLPPDHFQCAGITLGSL